MEPFFQKKAEYEGRLLILFTHGSIERVSLWYITPNVQIFCPAGLMIPFQRQLHKITTHKVNMVKWMLCNLKQKIGRWTKKHTTTNLKDVLKRRISSISSRFGSKPCDLLYYDVVDGTVLTLCQASIMLVSAFSTPFEASTLLISVCFCNEDWLPFSSLRKVLRINNIDFDWFL